MADACATRDWSRGMRAPAPTVVELLPASALAVASLLVAAMGSMRIGVVAVAGAVVGYAVAADVVAQNGFLSSGRSAVVDCVGSALLATACALVGGVGAAVFAHVAPAAFTGLVVMLVLLVEALLLFPVYAVDGVPLLLGQSLVPGWAGVCTAATLAACAARWLRWCSCTRLPGILLGALGAAACVAPLAHAAGHTLERWVEPVAFLAVACAAGLVHWYVRQLTVAPQPAVAEYGITF